MEGLKPMTDPNTGSIDMLTTALEMEEKGKSFYAKAVNTCRSPQCKEIFSALMRDETLHQERIKIIHATLTSGKGWTADWDSPRKKPEDLSLLFKNLAFQEGKKIKAETTDLEALDVGLNFESASVDFYQEHRKRSINPLESAFLDQMILEEKGHWKALKDIHYYLTDPEGWFMEKERAGLDGV
jgi:rubrerythrin